MPWPKVLLMDQRIEFIRLFQQPEVNRQELCRRFGISPKTAYKWLKRATSGDADWAQDRSRRPHNSPKRSGKTVEAAVLQIRDVHPAWGARKIRRRLMMTPALPSASTVHAILQRNDRVPAQQHPPHYTRFEHPAPNDLWQMDFKGRFAFRHRVFCHPLTMVDDHSRYNLCPAACANEASEDVQQQL
ncbi:helix-turn-helix domain-containing protein, partial [Rhodopseudomonas sp. B29]|uniref:helix-turn-helix domain-containing protein n=1 Tax=Rhodopseudomonas sp. B29 TaxID=95607 RepID=UPI000594C6DC